tara:strand:- start:1003 stop:1530 length:528 start_codon:yes stop_codon:yes gene_type:complete
MKVERKLNLKIKQDYIFIEGTLDINSNYFIKEINKSVKEENNNNYKTHVFGEMTPTRYFINNKEFIKTILPLLDYIDENLNPPKYDLGDAWGYKEGFADYTHKHHHVPAYLSGAIYLNEHSQQLIFPDIKQKITPKKGKFVLFSPFLFHYAKRHPGNDYKYGLSFNWYQQHVFDK